MLSFLLNTYPYGIAMGIFNLIFLSIAYYLINYRIGNKFVLYAERLEKSTGKSTELLRQRVDAMQQTIQDLRTNFKNFSDDYYGNVDFNADLDDIPGMTIEEFSNFQRDRS